MNIKTPDTNRSSSYYGGVYRSGRWFCSCNKETKYVETKRGPNAGRDFYKCPQAEMCGFWLWVEHEYEARRRLAEAMSPEPQTPSKPRYSNAESYSSSTPSSSSQSTAERSPYTSGSDRVLRSARQATPASSPIGGHPTSQRDSDQDDELAARVLSLLEGFNVQLNSRQKRKLQVVIDDYIEDMEKGNGDDDDGYVIG